MTDQRHNDPLHGVTLKAIVTDLAERFGWEELADLVRIKCFRDNPSIKSSLTFLRKTEWARRKVEDLWLLEHGHSIPKRPPLPQTEERDAGRKRTKKEAARPRINPWTGEPYENGE